jgi:hypothetical protein
LKIHRQLVVAEVDEVDVIGGPPCRAAIAGYRRLVWTEPVQYLEKATTSLRARAELDPPDFAQITDGVDLVVPVTVTGRKGIEVVHADITTWVTPNTHRD